ncbi:MAG: L,D-transpeptidase family protein [Verrucomicrobiota bacterium]
MKIIAAANPICRIFIAVIFFATTGLSFSETKSASKSAKDTFGNAHQMVLVTTKNWEAVPGVMRRFERKDSGESWSEAGSPIEIVVGRTGLAWGRGLHPTNSVGPQKVEGDGKSPAGIFRLSSAFGFASAEEMKSLKLPYLQVTDSLECVDDAHSVRYNTIVDRQHIINPDWKSSEKMLEIGEAYRLGIVVDHNVAPRTSGKGSCIFIHIWKGDGSGTSGCTAMEKSHMEKLISWLDAKTNPVLVQLPEAEFQRVESEWHLPSLKTNSPSAK